MRKLALYHSCCSVDVTNMFDTDPEYQEPDKTCINQCDAMPDFDKVEWPKFCRVFWQERHCLNIIKLSMIK